ncbi:uncharacterized protein LOC135462213 isoform X2 [Liolophura sinensis]|uniref:uncharacterized protein LOC135462213 isoform X2 n=1 Tax=Liolophura sinensis TaxID=3198878 RepID=UPI0031580BA3
MGKVKSVQPCYGSETGIEPTPNYDCHISAVSARAGDPFYPKLMKSQIFFYEYTDEALPAPCPRQCLPYAILTYKRPKHCAPVDHHSLKRNFFRSGKDRAEPGAQGPVSGEDASSYTDTTPGRYRAGSQHHRHNSGEADPRLSPSGTSIGRGRGAPLLPDPSLTIQQASTPDSGQPWSSGQNYPAPGLQSSSLYRRPLLQTPTLASATSDTTLSEGGHPLGPQRFVEDPRLACRSSQTSSASCSEQSYGDLERPLVMESPPVTGVTAEMCVLKVHQVEESSYQSITNSSKCTDMNTAVYANGLKSTEPQTLLNSRTTVAVSIPPLLPSAHLQHVNVSKVQESLTESQVAMLKQALNTSHVVSPMNLLSQQLAGEGLMSPGLSCSVTQGQTPLSSPLQKPKAGKQKLSLESYRQKKRKASSGQSANLSSDNQISGQSPQGSTLVPQQQQLTSDSVTCAEESSDFANLNPPQIEPEHPTLPVKGILKTRKASVEDISPVDDARMDQDTSVVVSELKDKHSLALQAPGSPCSVISSVSSIDGSSVTSSLSSNLAGSVTHSPAQADHKKNTQPKKKKKVNRMMMGYKKRRKRKRKSKSTTKADEVKEADDSVCDLDTSPSTDCLTKAESERSLPPQPKSRSNPLWNLASPPNDNDIDYNDFSYEQPHHFEMSIPDGLSPPPPLPAKRACLDLHRFGINHWSEAATDPRFQPSVLLVRSKVDAQTSIVSVPKDEDLLFDCPDSPDCASLVMVSDEKPSDVVRNTEIAVVKGPQRDTGCEGVADVGTEGICESDTTCEAFNVKPVPDDCNTQLSENNPAEDTRVTAKRTSVIDSNMYDVGEIEAAIDRHIKQSHAEDMYPKWPGITHPDLSKPVLCPGKRSTSQSTTQTSESVLCESGMEVSMDIIHRVAANILPYMEGNHSVSEISSTIAAILSPLPLPVPSLPVPARTSLPVPAPTSLPVPAPTLLPVSVPTSLPVQTLLNLPTALPVPVQTSLPLLTSLPVPAPTSLPVPTSLHEPASLTVPMSVPVTVPETCEKPVYPLESTENTMISPASPGQDYDSTSIALAILHEDSDDDDIFNPQPSPAKSDSNPAPSDDLYSAYIPESTHKTTNSESAEQTAAKWLGQMAQLCNMRKEEPEKTQLDFFESVRKTLNLNIRVHSAALPEEIPQVKTEQKNVSPEPEILTGASLVKPLTVKAEAELQIEVEKESQWDLKQCEETESTDQNIPVLSRVKQETFKHERKRPDKTIPVVSGAKCHRTVRDAQTGKNKQKNGKQVVVLTAAESEHNLSEGYESSTALNIHPDQIKPEVVKDSCQDTGLPPGDKHDQSDILRWFQDMITPKPGEKSQLISQTSNKNKTGVDRQLDRQSSADASQFENSVKEKVTNDIRSSEKGRSSRDSATVSNSECLSKRRHSLHSVSSSPSPGRGLVRQKSRRSPSDEGRYCDSATRTARSSSYASSRLSEREHHRYRSPSDSPRYCSGRRYSRNSYSRSRSHSPRRRHSGHSSSSGTSRHGSRTSSRSCSRSPDRRSDLLRRSPICRNRYRRKGRWSSSSRSFSRSHTPDSDREKKPLYRRSSICSPVSRRSSSSSPGRRVRDRSRSNSRSRYTRHSQGEWAPSQSSGTRSRKSPGTPVRRLRRQSSSQKSQSPGPLKHSEEIRHTVKRNSSPSLRRRSHRVSSRDKFPSDARQDGHDECCEGSDLSSGDEKEGCLSSVIVSHRVRRSSCDKTEERRSSVGYFKIENHDYDNNEAIQEKKATREGVCYGQDKIIPVSLCMSQVAVLSTVLNSSGSPVRQFEAKTLDDLDSERARLLLELDDLKNSDSDTASVISHYSKASNCSHGNKKLSPVQKNTKFEEEKAVADGKQIKLESKSSNASILTPETFRSEMTNSSCLPNAILESQQGLLQNFGSSQSPEPYYSQPQCSNLQTPVIAESWSSIMCNIENEKQEVVRGHTLNVSKVEQTQTLPGTVSENVPDMFQLECKTALNKMEKLKRKQEGQRAQALFNSPLHTWLSLFIPSSSNVYDEVLQEICRCMKLPRTKIFSGLSKKSRKATRKIADRLARICTAMEGTSDKIKTSTSISMDSPSSAGSYYTVKDWFATFINPGAKYFNAVVEDALLSLDISPFYKITSLPNEHCSQLRNRAEFYRKLWEKLNLPSYTDSSGSVNCTEQSTESDIQQPPLSKAQKPVENLNEGNYCYRVRNYSVPTTSLQETVLCDSCGKNPDIIGLNLAIKNLKEVKTSVERAAAYLKEYVGHMKIVLWNAKAFQSIRFSLDKSRGLLSTVNAFSSPIKRHFCDLAPAYENLVKVIGFSKYFFFKSRKVQIELVISSLKAVLEILDSAILSATCSLGELQVPEINTEENHESCNQCFHYIHTSLQSTAASDFISLEANQSSGHSSNNMYSPSEPTSEHSSADEQSQIPKFNFNTSWLLKDILATFERLKKTFENGHLDCSWKGTRMLEEITEKLLLPDEMRHGILYGGQGIWLQQTLSKKKYYQLMSFRGEILRINQLLQKYNERKLTLQHLQRSKRKMLNKRWNVFSIYTDKLSHASLQRLQDQSKILNECLLCLESARYPEIQTYKTDEMRERLQHLVERIPAAIELCQKGLAKLEEKQSSDRQTKEELISIQGSPLGSASEPLLHGSVCEPLGGEVKTSQSVSEMHSSLEDMDADASSTSGFQDEVSVWAKGAGPDPPHVKVTYFSSTNSVLEPSDHVLEKIAPRNDHTRWALAAALKSESSLDTRPVLVSSPRNDDTRRALATNTDVRATEYEESPTEDIDMRRTTEQKREILKFHVKGPSQKGIGRGRFQPNQHQGKPISSIGGQTRRPAYHRSYKQNSALYRSSGLLRNCSGRDAHVPVVQRYPFAVEEQSSCVHYYPNTSYNNYPSHQSNLVCMPNYGMPGNMPGNMPVGNPVLAYVASTCCDENST